jgi:sterol desaturase/sphingolipid hydroxylase (fatty acid hydroxylase superfamily)
MFANGHAPYVSWSEHPVYNVALLLVIPFWRELHFFAVHRLLHVPVLYRLFHKLHHNNVNILPWSGLAMHPVEHLMYFSVVLIHLVVPSNPLHAIFTLAHAGLTPAQGHVGFWRIGLGGMSLQSNTYPHYLHHKYFECNYADGAVPLDKWFGSFHDGTPEAQARMDARALARAAKANEKKRGAAV